jgi:putative nucleotidyltransferase with HDIG domain
MYIYKSVCAKTAKGVAIIMSFSKFVPVKPKILPLGVHLECEVYSDKPAESGVFREADDYSLLCENQEVTQDLIDRLKRAVFPKSMVYLPRDYVTDVLFSDGHYLGFSQEDVQAIRDGESPWLKVKTRIEITDIAPAKKHHVLKLEKATKKYEEAKVLTRDMIKDVASTGKFEKEQSEEVAEDIMLQVNEVEASLIITSINRIRTVDEYLHTHSLNVAYLNGLMGKWLKYDEERLSELVQAGLLHDIGKLRVSQEILNKPARLTPEEFAEVKKHPALSLETLTKSGVKSKIILDGVIQHHEKVNGSGYPHGLVARDICEFARITAISDIYDAMVTKRVYKDPHSPFVILNEFAQEGYSELDIKYVSVFIECMIDELRGKEVIMNNGAHAKVLLVNPRKLLYPIVEVDGKTITTDDNFKCVRMRDTLDD